MNEDFEKFEKRAKVLKALAHPVRLMILKELCVNRTNVTNIYTKLNLPQSTVSRHLAVLRSIGIVSCERDKLEMSYCVECENMEQYIKSLIWE